ncbi:hypothetical protein BH23GEM9_BH23GEM9_25150 [soil metagenome]
MRWRWWMAGTVAFMATALAAACAKDTAEPASAGVVLEAQAGDTVRVAVGQSVRVGSLTVAFRGIGEDSRCPIDVVCVWAGSAEALLDLSLSGATPTRVHLHTFREPGTATHGAYRVRLLHVSPAPLADQTITPSSYVVYLEISLH